MIDLSEDDVDWNIRTTAKVRFLFMARGGYYLL